jgi:halogenation protein CepH
MTSVGAVVRRELASKVQGNPEQVLYELIAECPLIADFLSGAKRITEGEYGKIRVRKDYSYRHTTFWRPGLALIGDAACFVDPVFSSGVHLATYSALLAARSINSVLEGVLDEQTAFDEFEARYRREFSVFYEFLASFYEMHVDENSYFWEARKVTKSSHTELEAFVTLVGGIASGEFSLDSGDALARRFSSEAREFGQAIDQQLASDGSSQVVPMFRSAVVRQAMQESAQVQARAQLGEKFENEVPVFPGGLVSSPDGLLWAIGGR